MRPIRLAFVALVVTGLLVALFPGPGVEGVTAAENSPTKARFIVGFHELPPGLQISAQYLSGTVLDLAAVGAWSWVETEMPDEFEAVALADPLVRSLERDRPDAVRPAYTPNDPDWSQQWGSRAVQVDLAWDLTLGSPEIRVCIVDGGVDYYHVDLAGNRYLGGHDYVDSDTDPLDQVNSHGTSVTGIIAATIDNGKNISGLAQVGFWNVRALDTAGWRWAVGKGIEWCTLHGADIINLSLQDEVPSQWIYDNVAQAWQAGVLLVAAAGNYFNYCPNDPDCPISYPASYAEVIAVTSIYENETICDNSRRGHQAELTAPGSSIMVLKPHNETENANPPPDCATSWAAPHVSGAAALLKSHKPCLTNRQIRERFNNTAEDLGTGGHDNRYGWGLVQAYDAMVAGGDEGACLRGYVKDQDTSDPIEDATVWIGGRSVQTGSDGSYEFLPFETGSYTINFTHPHYYPEGHPITLTSGRNWRNETLDPLVALHGYVWDQETRDPIYGATVKIQGRETQTLVGGYYEFYDLETDSWTMEFSHPMYYTKTFGVGIDPGRNWRNTTLIPVGEGGGGPLKPSPDGVEPPTHPTGDGWKGLLPPQVGLQSAIARPSEKRVGRNR